MKKSVIALILSVVCLFGGCDMSQMLGGILPNSNSDASDSYGNSYQDSLDGGNGTSDDNTSADGGNNGGNNGGSTSVDEHTDEDNNDKCDDCGETVAVNFNFVAINDLHGKFADTDTQPGVDELTAGLKELKAENEYSLFLSSGDMWQGSSESNFTKGRIITEWMNEVGFSAMTLGNHEYDWGEDYIQENADFANFPFLALNVYSKETNKLVDYCEPSVLVEIGEVKVGIIGAIGDCYSSISADKSTGITFKTGSALTSLVKAEANKLRSQGADCIVYSIHDGLSSDTPLEKYYDISLSDYVDLVFEGHSHQQYVFQDDKGVYHLQNGGDNDGVSYAQVKINFANETADVESVEFVPASAYSSWESDPIVNDLMEKYADEIAKASTVVGMNDRVRAGSEILQKVADLYYEAGLERWGSQYDIVLGGGFMSVRSPYNVYAGEVLYGDLMGVLPFDNQLVLCAISGSKLRSQFFETTNNRYYISYGSYGASVKNNIVDNKTYYVVTDTYSSLYAPNGMTEIVRYDENVYARDLLAKFIQEGGWGAPAGQITLTSIPEILGLNLAQGVTTSQTYYVKGEIVKIETDRYNNANLTIENENGKQLYIYRTYDSTGAVKFFDMSNPPKVGDTVVLFGVIMNYYGMIEMKDACIYAIE